MKLFRLFITLIFSSALFSQFNDSSFLHRFLANYDFIQLKNSNTLLSYHISNSLSYIYDDPLLESSDIPFLLDAEFHDFDAQINFNKHFFISTGISISSSGISDKIIHDYHDILGISGPEFDFFDMNQNNVVINNKKIQTKLYIRPITLGIINRLKNGTKYSFSLSYQLKNLFFTPKYIFASQIQKRFSDISLSAKVQVLLKRNNYYKPVHYSYSLSYLIYKKSIYFNYYYSSPLFREDAISYDEKNVQFTSMGKNYLFEGHTAISLKFVLSEKSPNINLEIIEDYINLFGKKITDSFLTHTNAPDFAIKLSLLF